MNRRHISRVPLQVIATLFLCAGQLGTAAQLNTGNLRLITQETSLGKVPFTAAMKQMAPSRDNRHVAAAQF